MSNSNLFPGDLVQTSLNTAYQFQTFSDYIKQNGLHGSFSAKCIFCSSIDTKNLVGDGSFKNCNRCKKQFKASFVSTS
jgi:hypothetical protein